MRRKTSRKRRAFALQKLQLTLCRKTPARADWGPNRFVCLSDSCILDRISVAHRKPVGFYTDFLQLGKLFATCWFWTAICRFQLALCWFWIVALVGSGFNAIVLGLSLVVLDSSLLPPLFVQALCFGKVFFFCLALAQG